MNNASINSSLSYQRKSWYPDSLQETEGLDSCARFGMTTGGNYYSPNSGTEKLAIYFVLLYNIYIIQSPAFIFAKERAMHFGTRLESMPSSLNVRFKLGTTYDQAKEFLEGLGLAIPPQDRMWDMFCTMVVAIPEGSNLNHWLSKIQGRTRILYSVRKMMFHHANPKPKTA